MMDGPELITLDAARAAQEPSPHTWPAAAENEAFHGPAGRFVKTVSPHSEADEAALLFQFVTAFGSAVGRGPHFPVEADRHGVNINVVCVGETAKARKGTSWGQVKRVMVAADPDWEQRIMSGLSSGEGLIMQVRDQVTRQEPVKEKGRVIGYEDVIVDEGVDDKRLLVCEGEFASVLRVSGRDGNTLSPVMRNAWDSGNLRILTKNNPVQASEAHISIIGHITRDELLRYLNNTKPQTASPTDFYGAAYAAPRCFPKAGT